MEKKEAHIVYTAMILFLERGYRKVTMTEIAEAAGMSRPALYASFANRLAIFDTIIREHAKQHAQDGDAVMRSDFTALGRLTKLYHIWVLDYFEGEHAVNYEQMNALTLQSNIVTPAAAQFYWGTFEAQIAEAIGLWPPKAPKMTSEFLASIALAATRDFKIQAPTKVILRAQIEGLIAMTLGALDIPQ